MFERSDPSPQIVANPKDYRWCPYDANAIGLSHLRMPKAEFITAIERRDPARVPCWYNWISYEFRALYPVECLELERAHPNDFIMVMPARPEGWHPDQRGANEFGVWFESLEDGVGGQPGGSYLDDWAKLDDYLERYIPDPHAVGRLDHVARIVADNPDVYVMGHWAYGPFEQMHAIRGMEQLFLDLYLNRQKVMRLGEALMAYWSGLIRGFAAAGVDGIFFTDDWGSQKALMISPAMWREIFKPWYCRLFDEAHSLGLHTMLHSCGNITAIVGDLIEVGLDILNPIQPHAMDGPAMVEAFGDRLTFCGGVDVQHFLVESTPDEVESGIRHIIETFDGPGGGFIIAPANSIMPETPLENVQTMFRAMRSHGLRD